MSAEAAPKISGEAASEISVEAAPKPGPSTLSLQFARFRRNRMAILSVWIMVVIVLGCFFGPYAFPFTGEDANFDYINTGIDFSSPHLFGTDEFGRDLLVRVLEGGQVSLTIGFLGALVGGVVGVFYGAVAGFCGGRIDTYMMRFVEVLYGFPYLIMVILISLVLGGGTFALFVALTITLWLTPAVIVRAEAEALAKREFVQAARAGGMTGRQIVVSHIVPNCLAVIIVYAGLMVPEVILAESYLSFLGIGIQPPQASLGSLVDEGTEVMQSDLRLLLLPGGLLTAVLLCLFFIADGLRDAFDPNDR